MSCVLKYVFDIIPSSRDISKPASTSPSVSSSDPPHPLLLSCDKVVSWGTAPFLIDPVVTIIRGLVY